MVTSQEDVPIRLETFRWWFVWFMSASVSPRDGFAIVSQAVSTVRRSIFCLTDGIPMTFHSNCCVCLGQSRPGGRAPCTVTRTVNTALKHYYRRVSSAFWFTDSENHVIFPDSPKISEMRMTDEISVVEQNRESTVKVLYKPISEPESWSAVQWGYTDRSVCMLVI